MLGGRHFYGFELWRRARATGADLLWRVKKNQYLPCEQRLRDGSYLSTVYAPRPQRSGGVVPGGSRGVRAAVPPHAVRRSA